MEGHPGDEPEDTSRAPDLGDPEFAGAAALPGDRSAGVLPGWRDRGDDDAGIDDPSEDAARARSTPMAPGAAEPGDDDDDGWGLPAPTAGRFDPAPPPGGETIPPFRPSWEQLDEVPPIADDEFDDLGPSAPPVVVVVVTHDPGPWFEEALEALGEQDYPALSVLVIDSGSEVDPTPRVADVLPTAFVRRLGTNVGFAAAANEVLTVVEGASHFVFAHDDIAPDPDAIRLMVEEAFRSNAGVVAPKLVDWDDGQRLLQIGLGADKSGAPADLVDAGELDQEQHDSVRDVFCAPGAFTLVRADLFASIGGFDPVMVAFGEDLDLSWRAQVAGARVIVTPAARVRHREAMSIGLRTVPGVGARRARSVRDRVRPNLLRHRLRTVLTCYSLWHLVRVLPQITLLAAGEFVYGIVKGRRSVASAVFGAWRWNLSNLGELRRRRRAVQATRVLPDSEVRRLQVRGSARMTAFVRGQLSRDDDHAGLAAGLVTARAELVSRDRLAVGVWAVIGAVLVLGSRHLLTGRLPSIGEIAPFPENPGSLLSAYASSWRTPGLGAEGPAPAALALLGLAGAALLGAMGLLQKILVLGPIVAGVIGAYRLARPLGDRPRLVAAAVYVALPLPYDALARGRWSGLIAYGLVPWLAAVMFRAVGLAPFTPSEPAVAVTPGGRAGSFRSRWSRISADAKPRPLLRAAVGLGVLTAAGAALAPAVVFLPLLLAVGVVAGSLVAGGLPTAVRAAPVAVGAVVVTMGLLFPWTLDFLPPGATWTALTGVDVAPARGLGLGRLLRFETGPLGAAPLGWAFVVAAILPLVIGRGWRLAWAARMWVVACIAWAVVLAGGRLGIGMPAPELVLAPAGLAVAVAVALGLSAFEIDLPGYRFGWRQMASLTAAVAVGLSGLPWLLAATSGRWSTPPSDLATLVSWMPEQRSAGDFRVLWVGDPEALPVAGWRLDEGVAYATSRGGAPTVADSWPSSAPGASGLLGDALSVARQGQTTSLGHLLAPMAVRYVILPNRSAPGRGRTGALPPPRDLSEALVAQVDLRQLESDRSITVYENAAWGPLRSKVAGETLEALRRPGLASAVLTDLTGAAPVLGGGDRTVYQGPITPGYVYQSEALSDRWQLTVDGETMVHDSASWANAFAIDQAGVATLRHRSPPALYLALLVQFGLWIAALRWLLHSRARRRTVAA